MTESEAIKEVRFNMSKIGLSDKAAKRVVKQEMWQSRHLKSRYRRNLNMRQMDTQTENWYTIMQNALYVDTILSME